VAIFEHGPATPLASIVDIPLLPDAGRECQHDQIILVFSIGYPFRLFFPFVFNNLWAHILIFLRALTWQSDKLPASFLLPGLLRNFDRSDVFAALAPQPRWVSPPATPPGGAGRMEGLRRATLGVFVPETSVEFA
jgi:hypothetical protein